MRLSRNVLLRVLLVPWFALILLAAAGDARAGCRIAGAMGIIDGAAVHSHHAPIILVPFDGPAPLYTFKDASGIQRYHDGSLLNRPGAHLVPPVEASLGALECAGLTQLSARRIYVVWEPPGGASAFTPPDGSVGGIRIDVAPGVAVGVWFSGGVHARPGGAVQLGNQSGQTVNAAGAITVSLSSVRMHFVLLATGAPFQPGVHYPQSHSLGRLKYVASPDDPASVAPLHTNDLYVRSGKRTMEGDGLLGPFELASKLSTCSLKHAGVDVAPVTSVRLASISAEQLSTPGAASEADAAEVDWSFRCDALLDRRPRVRFDAGIAAPADTGVALPATNAVVGVQLLDSRGAPIALGRPSQGFPWIAEAGNTFSGMAICEGTLQECEAGSDRWVTSAAGAAGAGDGRMGDVFPLRFRYFRRSDKTDPVVPGPIQVRFTVTLDTP